MAKKLPPLLPHRHLLKNQKEGDNDELRITSDELQMSRYITFFLLLVCSVVWGQDVEAILTEKVKLLDKSYTTKELQTLAKDFETLATSAASHWLVNY